MASVDWSSMHDQLYSGEELNTTVLNITHYLDFYEGMFIHPHHYQYLEYFHNLSNFWYYLVGIYIMFACGFGALGNFLVIYIFTTTRSLRTPPNMLLVNLAISDFGFSVVNGFPLMTISAILRRWVFGTIACQTYAALGGVFGYCSIMTLVFVSADRYYVISNPFEAMRKCTKGRALVQIAFIWTWAALLSALPLFGFGQYILEGMLIECGFDFFTQTISNKIYNHVSFYVGFVFPVGIIIMCYIMIVRAVAAQSAMMRSTAEKMKGEAAKDDREKKQEIQLAKIAAGTITLFILSWITYGVVCQIAIWGGQEKVGPMLGQLPAMVAKSSACWNPILYCLSHPKFRAVLEEKFPFLLCCKGSNIDHGEDEKSEVTKTTKGRGLKRGDSDYSEDGSEMSGSVVENSHAQVNAQPSGAGGRGGAGPRGHQHHRMATPQDSYAPSGGHAPYHAGADDVNPRAMTRAANTIFNHLVTAYEGMRVLTTSGDGAGANRVINQGFDNPGYMPYYYPTPSQPGVYSIPVPGAQPMMMMAPPGAPMPPGAAPVPTPVAPGTPLPPGTPVPAASPAPVQPSGTAPQPAELTQRANPQPQLNNPPQQQANQHQPPPNPLSAPVNLCTDPITTLAETSEDPSNKPATTTTENVGDESNPSLPPEPNLNNSSNNATESKMDVTSCKQDSTASNTGSHNIAEVPEPPNSPPKSSTACISSEDLELPPPPEELLDETEDNQSEASYSFRKDDDTPVEKDQCLPPGPIEHKEKPQMSISERIKLFNNGELKQNNSFKNSTVMNNSPTAPNSQNAKSDSANIDKPMDVPAVKSCLNSDTKQSIDTPSSQTQNENKAPTCPEVESKCEASENKIKHKEEVKEESDNTQSQHIKNKQDNVNSVDDAKLEASINNTASLEPNLPNVDSTKGPSIKDAPDTSNKKAMTQYSIDYEDGFC